MSATLTIYQTGDICRESLTPGEAHAEYLELNGQIIALRDAFVGKLVDATEEFKTHLLPLLDEMQSMLSQRGTRRKLLNVLGVPTWEEWFEQFEELLQLDVSLRQVQRWIKGYRERESEKPEPDINVIAKESIRHIESKKQLEKLQSAVKELTRDRRNGGLSYKRSRVEQKEILLKQGCKFERGDTMIEGINAAMIIRSKQDAAGKKTSLRDAVNYASGAMNKLKPVDPEKVARISEVRSKAGKLGRAKQLAEGAQACQDFAQVCPDLPEVAQILPGANGFGFDYGFAVDVDFAAAADDDRDDEVASLPRRVRGAASQLKAKQEKQNPKPETKTNPVGTGGSLASKTKTIKTARGEQPMPFGFDSWDNADRIVWVKCTCEPFDKMFHLPGCPSQAQAKAAIAGEGFDIEEI